MPCGVDTGVRIRVASAAYGTAVFTPVSSHFPPPARAVDAGSATSGADGSCSAAVSSASPAATAGRSAARCWGVPRVSTGRTPSASAA